MCLCVCVQSGLCSLSYISCLGKGLNSTHSNREGESYKKYNLQGLKITQILSRITHRRTGTRTHARTHARTHTHTHRQATVIPQSYSIMILETSLPVFLILAQLLTLSPNPLFSPHFSLFCKVTALTPLSSNFIICFTVRLSALSVRIHYTTTCRRVRHQAAAKPERHISFLPQMPPSV